MDRLAADRMFAAVVESGSFAGAAQRLGTSSGQASKLVSRLESELGVRLLHRTTRWNLKRKIETMERSLTDIRAAAMAQRPPEPVAASAPSA